MDERCITFGIAFFASLFGFLNALSSLTLTFFALRFPMRFTETILVGALLAWLLCIGEAQAQAPRGAADQALEEVLVTGEHPGPGMWRVLNGDHTLWILGTHAPLPIRMQWRSEEVEIVISEAQQVIGPYSASFATRGGNPLAMRGKPLRRLLSRRAYSQWQALKRMYIGDNDEIERALPVTAALILRSNALHLAGLGDADVVLKEVHRLARDYQVPVTNDHEVVKLVDGVPTDAAAERRGIAFLAQTLANLESDLRAARARANAWATGDIDALRAQALADGRAADLYANSWPYLAPNELADLAQRADARWLEAAEKALRRNRTTVAILPIFMLLQPDGLMARLRERGFEVIEPGH
jgi:hypothetical protein